LGSTRKDARSIRKVCVCRRTSCGRLRTSTRTSDWQRARGARSKLDSTQKSAALGMLYTALERIVNWQFIRPTTHADLTGVLVGYLKNCSTHTHGTTPGFGSAEHCDRMMGPGVRVRCVVALAVAACHAALPPSVDTSLTRTPGPNGNWNSIVRVRGPQLKSLPHTESNPRGDARKSRLQWPGSTSDMVAAILTATEPSPSRR
jgi:hypothetical protein